MASLTGNGCQVLRGYVHKVLPAILPLAGFWAPIPGLPAWKDPEQLGDAGKSIPGTTIGSATLCGCDFIFWELF